MNALDANVLVHALDRRDARKRATAQHLIASITNAVTLWQVAVEFIAASRKLAGAGPAASDAWYELDRPLVLFPLATPAASSLSLCRDLTLRHKVSHWDALIYAACLDAGVATLFSEDVPASPTEGLAIVNPSAETLP
jgi:predicted nucleic acid-binding protein